MREKEQRVDQGALLATLRDLPLQSDLEQAQANLSMASERAKAASLHYAEYGPALKVRERLSDKLQEVSQKDAALKLTSPIAGTVITPGLQDLVGTYLNEGQELLEVADLSKLRARIYVSEYDLYKIEKAAKARLQVQGMFKTWAAQIVSIAPRPIGIGRESVGESRAAGNESAAFLRCGHVRGQSGRHAKTGDDRRGSGVRTAAKCVRARVGNGVGLFRAQDLVGTC